MDMEAATKKYMDEEFDRYGGGSYYDTRDAFQAGWQAGWDACAAALKKTIDLPTVTE